MKHRAQIRWHAHADADELIAAALNRLEARAAAAIAARGSFDVVLSGGSTPRPLYQAAVQLDTDWACWHVWFADERCLPLGDAERNDAMVRQVWLDRVPVPEGQIHPIPAERGPEAGAAAYQRSLEAVGAFDLVLLGLGEDGHTASLFPGHDAGAEPDAPAVLPVRGAPKPPPERVSLSAARLSDARAVEVLVTGRGKRTAIQKLREGADTPLTAVVPEAGIDVFFDAAAGAPL